MFAPYVNDKSYKHANVQRLYKETHVFIYNFIHTYHTCIRTNKHTNKNSYIYTCIRANIYTNKYTYVQNVHTCKHTYMNCMDNFLTRLHRKSPGNQRVNISNELSLYAYDCRPTCRVLQQRLRMCRSCGNVSYAVHCNDSKSISNIVRYTVRESDAAATAVLLGARFRWTAASACLHRYTSQPDFTMPMCPMHSKSIITASTCMLKWNTRPLMHMPKRMCIL